jgi:hypothetical protein
MIGMIMKIVNPIIRTSRIMIYVKHNIAKVDHQRCGEETRHDLVEEKIKTLVIKKWVIASREVIESERSYALSHPVSGRCWGGSPLFPSFWAGA